MTPVTEHIKTGIEEIRLANFKSIYVSEDISFDIYLCRHKFITERRDLLQVEIVGGIEGRLE